MDISVSLVLLTYNRLNTTYDCLARNLRTADYPIRELIHVDNGSAEPLAECIQKFKPAIQILHSENQGVAKGYNRGMMLSTSSHIVITGCDRIMPDGWLRDWVAAATFIQNTGVISLYSDELPEEERQKRYRGDTFEKNDIKIRPAFACEARMHSREFLIETGLFREDFGLYGFEDVEWCERAERVAAAHDLINYILPHQTPAAHMRKDNYTPLTNSGEPYGEWKKKENDQPWKKELAEFCWRIGNPYYHPYARIEEDLSERFRK